MKGERRMKNLKKIILTLTILLFLILCINVSTPKVDAATYNEPETEFRAAWVSSYIGEIEFQSIDKYKESVDNILDILEYYNMNAIVFHIRATHDAWYNSEINKLNPQLVGLDFETFDPLAYIIEESHKRGIEFHAWLNPYRISKSDLYSTKEEIVEAYKDYPTNPASNPDNILLGESIHILDPGRPEVREFIIDTCMEVVENYDVDAIHFDDYFYAKGINDYTTRSIYNTSGLSIADFRREQVTTFIRDLKSELDAYNEENNKTVQLGISPTGVYRNASSWSEANSTNYQYNANGDLTYPKGGTVGCQEHYESYLYCDTLKWINEELINYILPQTYWQQSHSSGPFESLMKWWNAAVKYKDVNLYSGMGIYMWKTYSNEAEAYEQTCITSNLENVDGTCIFSFKHMKAAYDDNDTDAKVHMDMIKNKSWTHLVPLPEVAGFESIEIGAVENLVINKNTISWKNLEDAKYYIIYRSSDEIDYSNSQIVDFVGGTDEIMSWTDSLTGDFVYDVVPVSYTNTIGKPSKYAVSYEKAPLEVKVSTTSSSTDAQPFQDVVNLTKGTNAYLFVDGYNVTDFTWTSSNTSVGTISNGVVTLKTNGTTIIKGILKTDITKYCEVTLNSYTGATNQTSYTVTFIDYDGSVLKTESVKYGTTATPPTTPSREESLKYSYSFAGWDTLFYNVTSDLTVQAVYDLIIHSFTVIFKNMDGTVLKTQEVAYGQYAIAPDNPKMDSDAMYTYGFKEWDKEFNNVTSDMTITAVYNCYPKQYIVKFVTNGGATYNDIYQSTDSLFENPGVPTKTGYVFAGWYKDSLLTEKVEFPCHILENTTLYAKWEEPKAKFTVNFYNKDNQLITSQTVTEGECATSISIPYVKDHTERGWYLNDEEFNFETPITSNIDLYAKYDQIVEKESCMSCDSSTILVFTSFITLASLGAFMLNKKK